jgi:hypothetical protein
MRIVKWLVMGSMCLLLPGASTWAAPPVDVPGKVRARLEADGDTPFQRALKEKIKERGHGNKDVPSQVEFGQLEITEESDATWTRRNKGGQEETLRGRRLKATARTRVVLAHPYEAHDPGAGQEKKDVAWPELKVKRQRPVGDKGDFEPDPDPGAVDDYGPEYYRQAQDQLGQPCEVTDADGNVTPGVPLWKGYCKDATGAPDYSRGLYEWGREPREVEVVEELVYTFPEASAESLEAPRELPQLAPAGVSDTEAILMGFTYTGPGIDYTIGDTWRICVWPFGCATIYDIRAGFALDWDLGLRLPAQASFTGLSDMVAGQEYGFSSWVWSTDWAALDYAGTGVEPNAGNEYVLSMDFFAGAKVIILGANVCPFCQYVEFSNDYSTSFVTPFGDGASFPIDPIRVGLKQWDYGIVALGLGLQIQPSLGSTAITAAVQGPGISSVPVSHAQPGQPTLIPVKACIAGGTHTANYQLTDFRYWFNEFALSMGAFLDLQVFGYGVWNPIVPIQDLDLSSLSDGLYLGKHVQCDWKFHCHDAGPDNSIGLASTLVDVEPPTSSIEAGVPNGRNGWYVSDVPVAMGATDNPPGCGIGVLLTEYRLDGGEWRTYAPFTLTGEGFTAVSVRSRDTDGNQETANGLEVRIDKSPPVVSGAPTRDPNSYGWYNDDVVVHFTAFDLVSGMDTLTPDVTLRAEAFGQTAEGTATDVAGNSASFTVRGIHVDKTAPAIVITSPSPAVTYSIREGTRLSVRWMASDALSLVRTEQARLDGRGLETWVSWDIDMPLVGGGHHSVGVSALDYADNLGEARVDFVVDVDIDGLLAATAYFCANGGLKTPGICKSLMAKATEAKRYMGLGQWTDARGVLGAYENELDAQQAKGVVSPIPYELLRMDARWVLDHYVLNQTGLTASN